MVRDVSGQDGRIIPARAGFTPAALERRQQRGDHPRSRGVYRKLPVPPIPTHGSSPLARGLLGWGSGGDDARRIIPARAGFTMVYILACHNIWDHPRSRGVYAENSATPAATAGSSPLARGLQDTCHTTHKSLRIIPARAGFTPATCPLVTSSRDHPRSRGVYAIGLRVGAPAPGSSPLARGLLDEPADPARDLGIIPARAGFTRPRRPSQNGRRDHPRSRGVYTALADLPPAHRGSSPLARGLPECRRARRRGPGGSSPLARGLPG